MPENEKIYEIGGKKFIQRKELSAEDWDLFIRGNEIIGDIRARKISINPEQKEIEIKAGDFTKDEFWEFASFGFVCEDGSAMGKELCSKLSMKDSLEGFTAFFFVLIELEIFSANSMMSNDKAQKLMKKLSALNPN